MCDADGVRVASCQQFLTLNPQYQYRSCYQDHPFEVMTYAIKHGYKRLMDVSERRALGLSPPEALGLFSTDWYIAWVSLGLLPIPPSKAPSSYHLLLAITTRLNTMLSGSTFCISRSPTRRLKQCRTTGTMHGVLQRFSACSARVLRLFVIWIACFSLWTGGSEVAMSANFRLGV